MWTIKNRRKKRKKVPRSGPVFCILIRIQNAVEYGSGFETLVKMQLTKRSPNCNLTDSTMGIERKEGIFGFVNILQTMHARRFQSLCVFFPDLLYNVHTVYCM